MLAVRLAEYGECEHALHHLEAIAIQVLSSSVSVNVGFIANVVELSTDLHFMQLSNNLLGNIEVLDWLEDLKRILNNTGNVSKEYFYNLNTYKINLEIFFFRISIL